MGLIVRTAGSNKTKNDIDHDLQTLIKTWNGKMNRYDFKVDADQIIVPKQVSE